jgi:hypothetical protein
VGEIWHRILDAHSFTWLRDALKSAISAGSLSEEFSEALMTLEWIAETGIANGCFIQAEIADHVHPPESWMFNRDLPEWANDL